MIIQGTNKPITIEINKYWGSADTLNISCRLYHVDGLGKRILLNKWGQTGDSSYTVTINSTNTKTTISLNQKQSDTMKYTAGKCLIEAKLRSGADQFVDFVTQIEDRVVEWSDTTILGEDN